MRDREHARHRERERDRETEREIGRQRAMWAVTARERETER